MAPPLKCHYKPREGYHLLLRRGKRGMEFLELGLLRMPAALDYRSRTGGKELLLVVLGGMIHLEVKGQRWEFLGQRRDVFDGPATAAYIPPGYPFKLTSVGESEVAFAWAVGGGAAGGEPYIILPPQVEISQRGGPGFRREIHVILPLQRPAGRLIAGETFQSGGEWSSYPPHKHDEQRPPQECRLEEIYLYRIDPARGFGMQRIYSPEGNLDEALVLKDRMAVGIRSGYHPVVSAPGYRLYYLWFLAGESRELLAYDDPDHSWVASGKTR